MRQWYPCSLAERPRPKQNSMFCYRGFRKVILVIYSNYRTPGITIYHHLTEASCVFICLFFWPLQTKYRQKPESLKFTAVVDSPDLIHAKNSYLQCNDVGFI